MQSLPSNGFTLHRSHQANRAGFILIIAVLVLTSLLVAGSYLAVTSVGEHKIGKAQSVATDTYYLAEAAVHDMMWKIKNDTATRTAFLSGTLGSSSNISRSSVFGDPRAAYSVSAISTAPAEAAITATSTYQLSNASSRRVVKAYVNRAVNDSGNWEFASFSGGRGSQQNGNFNFTGSGQLARLNGGRLHANQVVKIQKGEVIVTDGSVTSSNVINVTAGGTLTLQNSTQEAPTSTVTMLQIDFDSADVNSWKNRATATYTPAAFAALPSGTSLTGVIYVTGDATLSNKNFTITGVLVAEGDVIITNSGKAVMVNVHAGYGGGLLAKDDVTITGSGGSITANGLVYAADNLTLNSTNSSITVNGAVAGFDASASVSGGPLTITYTPANYANVIAPEYNPSSPLIQVDHWEEEY